ncbi:methylated-DNA-protein-cysteine methyltransferase related protein [Halolactibacillus halophilus]|uniref:Methylated-DNA--[protein]-cysteine S-methyltransferase n=1 Tax=Halolactibacillus halophilus TaxID=306540 RepID=A0A1I5RDY9_9BACI|nr:MGMT family protein [Halolactibacillus halophilus]GEM02182.1 methylated-DNA--[protein]-cysteine S-methyltransferase [Halolactibacillus halophilus]SFP56557.1 methylated-DNA-protein-cysteine methyltransferase related protein [Halolactibacillus halophilus]
MISDFKQAVIKIVASTKPGEWISYGDVAVLAGRPRAARAVSGILKREKDTLPWHRVVGKGGKISIKDPELKQKQITKLQQEGLKISKMGQISNS